MFKAVKLQLPYCFFSAISDAEQVASAINSYALEGLDMMGSSFAALTCLSDDPYPFNLITEPRLSIRKARFHALATCLRTNI